MARDGNIDLSLDDARKLAIDTIKDLDERNGDPSRRGSWVRERKLARILFTLTERIRDAGAGFEVPYP